MQAIDKIVRVYGTDEWKSFEFKPGYFAYEVIGEDSRKRNRRPLRAAGWISLRYGTYLVMSTSLVSLRKIVPMIRVMTATPIGYQRP